VGRNTICDAVRQHDLKTPAEITACVKAGGNCGSCVPELRKLLVEIRWSKRLNRYAGDKGAAGRVPAAPFSSASFGSSPICGVTDSRRPTLERPFSFLDSGH
jgi:bacterioferritin-associated ferredoxin